MDYAMLARHSIQSTSDTEDYIKYSTIAANAPSALTPEQAAVWSYPLKEGDSEEAVFNMVNAMLLRIHQSGHLAEISKERFALVKEGIAYYKKIRADAYDSSIPAEFKKWIYGGGKILPGLVTRREWEAKRYQGLTI